ncbi:MAG: 16S rRNA (guanine(966)-N(2))-methyltransferase RsmD [Candidatus Dormibacteraeota bacterium]|nr:16S rRNA (guanine(966)-N(2))-methyltransferase RsmD [Candidatus Dormibacteraeota bacterium]
MHGGELGGRRLLTPRGIRPSQGIVKEAVYNVLAAEIEGAGVIDLFAGSGALGIEALSRGARQVTFVEADPKVAGVLRRNLAALGLVERSRVHIGDAVRWVDLHPAEVAAADLVLLDPPYNDAVLGEVLALIDRTASGTVVAEWSGRGALPELERLAIRRDRSYGATRLTILTPR